jgi:hypothetical protein
VTTKWTDPHPRRQINEPPKKVNHKGKENQVPEPPPMARSISNKED